MWIKSCKAQHKKMRIHNVNEAKEEEAEKVAIVLSDMCETFCRCETEWMNKKKGWESKYLLVSGEETVDKLKEQVDLSSLRNF